MFGGLREAGGGQYDKKNILYTCMKSPKNSFKMIFNSTSADYIKIFKCQE